MLCIQYVFITDMWQRLGEESMNFTGIVYGAFDPYAVYKRISPCTFVQCIIRIKYFVPSIHVRISITKYSILIFEFEGI